MEKSAQTAHPIHDLLQERWSPRAFSGESIDKKTLTKLLEAARWAPSAFNSQPWRFIVAMRDDSEAFETMRGCLMPGNQRWTGETAVLIILAAQLQDEPGGKKRYLNYFNAGLAVAQMTIEAAANGLHTHQMAGIDRDKIRETYGVPEEFAPLVGIAIGKLGDAASLPDDLRARENGDRTRKPLSEIAFAGAWGQAADL
ncbi:MAG: nitroreductase family protein [Chloroflexota bacterium]